MSLNRDSIYFVSDMHFGVPDRESSFKREKLFVKWLEKISEDASDIYIMGDMFDFWFEWKHVVPKGYIRLLGKMAELSDKGIKLHLFTGNHDMWMFSYFRNELGAFIYRKDIVATIQHKVVCLAHGDGLGPGDYGYKFIKKLFRNKFAQWCYARLHPNFAVWLALFFSRKSRYINREKNKKNRERERKLTENQLIHARQMLKTKHIDYFVFGHQHTPECETLENGSVLYNIGNWLNDFTYLKMKNSNIEQCVFTKE